MKFIVSFNDGFVGLFWTQAVYLLLDLNLEDEES